MGVFTYIQFKKYLQMAIRKWYPVDWAWHAKIRGGAPEAKLANLVLALGISAEAYGVPGTIWGEPCRRLEQYLDLVGMFDGREFGFFFFFGFERSYVSWDISEDVFCS